MNRYTRSKIKLQTAKLQKSAEEGGVSADFCCNSQIRFFP